MITFVLAAALATFPEVGPELRIDSSSSAPQRLPAITLANASYTVGWTDYRFPTSSIGLAFVDATGVPALLGPITDDTSNLTFPALSPRQGKVLVAFGVAPLDGGSEIRGAYLAPTGGLSQTFDLSYDAGAFSYQPHAASSPSGWLVVWTQDKAGVSEVRGVVVDAVTGTRGTGSLLFSLPGQGVGPDVAFDGMHYVVVFGVPVAAISGSDIYATRVNLDGSLVAPTPVALSSGAGRKHGPVIAAGAGLWLVAWLNDGTQSVEGALYDTSGSAVAGPFQILSFAGGIASGLQVSFDGERFVVMLSNSSTLESVSVQPDGGLGTPSKWANGSSPAADFAGASVGLVAYQGQLNTWVYLRTLRPVTDGGACDVSSDCSTQNCQEKLCVAPGQRPDSGVVDGGAPLPDGGTVSAFDGGTEPPGPRTFLVGCGCVEGAGGTALWLALLALRAARRSR